MKDVIDNEAVGNALAEMNLDEGINRQDIIGDLIAWMNDKGLEFGVYNSCLREGYV